MELSRPLALPARKPAILSIGGGKGGVGKTCVAVNLAVTIAQRGWRTVLVDADLSCANVEAVLGVDAEYRMDDFFAQPRQPNLDSYLSDTPYPGLRFLAGASGVGQSSRPRPQRKRALIDAIDHLDADLVIIDLDAGAHPTGLDFFLQSRPQGMVVITPERTSIDNAFKFLRACFFRHVESFYAAPELHGLLRRYSTLDRFLSSLEGMDMFPIKIRQQISHEILELARAFRPRLIVNKAQSAYEAKIAANILAKLTRNHLRFEAQSMGFLHFDGAVPESVNSGTPFVADKPRLALSGCMGDLANRLGYF